MILNKNILLPVIAGIAALGCLVAVNANYSAMKQKLTLERYNRLEAEKNLELIKRNSLRLEDQLTQAKQKLEGIQSIVNEGQSTASQLKSKVQVTSQENENLKASIKKLQDELASSQKAAAEKAAAMIAQTPVPVTTAVDVGNN